MNCIDPYRHPLLSQIAQKAAWTSEDQFPSCLEWADEHEVWLQFISAKGEWNRYLPRLQGPAYQRDRAFSEICAAYFLETKCALPIIDWEPLGKDGRKGEFLVGCGSEKIFVEVKTGGWQKDIVDGQGRNSPRLAQPKYIPEARSVAPWAVIRNAVANAYPQFPGSVPTLLIIKDDYFVELDRFNADIALSYPAAGKHAGGYLSENGCFVDRRYKDLGGVGIFRVELPAEGLRYSFELFDNPNANDTAKLPVAAFQCYPRPAYSTNIASP